VTDARPRPYYKLPRGKNDRDVAFVAQIAPRRIDSTNEVQMNKYGLRRRSAEPVDGANGSELLVIFRSYMCVIATRVISRNFCYTSICINGDACVALIRIAGSAIAPPARAPMIDLARSNYNLYTNSKSVAHRNVSTVASRISARGNTVRVERNTFSLSLSLSLTPFRPSVLFDSVLDLLELTIN